MGLHTYPDEFERWCWRTGRSGSFAIDAEHLSRPLPSALVRFQPGASRTDFWTAWTRLEVVAKLSDTPAVLLLKSGGLDGPLPPGVTIEHVRYGDTICCFAEARSDDA